MTMEGQRTGFHDLSQEFLANSQLRSNLRHATSTIRRKRYEVIGEVADWEYLREKGREIKDYSLNHLDQLLSQLEDSVTSRGGQVHFALDAKDANEVIYSIIQSHQVEEVIKVKSLTTDEIELNRFLELNGIHPLETDLAELIVQLANDKPSHILVPAIHKNRSEIRELFERTIASGRHLGETPSEIAEASRLYLREKFLHTKVAISGVNFAVAETGTVCVVESEGNGRMCITLPEVLISVMGIEKVIPTLEDLGVMLELLPRSSTGERMNPYTSLWSGLYPENDGPKEFHLVVIDNGRTRVLSDPSSRATLRCIRCSACLNVCPVYERVGSHAYDSVYPGPIGAILSPQLFGSSKSGTLPWASTLCGACYEVCPVKIDIPSILVHQREQMIHQAVAPKGERVLFRIMSTVLSSSKLYSVSRYLFRYLASYPRIVKALAPMVPMVSQWVATREIPEIPVRNWRDDKRGQVGEHG